MYIPFLYFAVIIFLVESKKLPSYIKVCKVGPNLPECALRNAKLAMLELLKGDEDYHIPLLSPLHLDKVNIKVNDIYEITLKNVTLTGLETADVHNNYFDFNKQVVGGKISFKWLKLLSDYSTSYKKLKNENGFANITFEDVTITYDFKFNLTSKDGKHYLDHIFPKADYDIKKIDYHFIVNGNKQSNDEMNNLLNEDPDGFKKDLSNMMSHTISSTIIDIFEKILFEVPFEELILAE